MNIIKSFVITKITSLLYDFELTQLEAIYNTLWKLRKENINDELQRGDNKTTGENWRPKIIEIYISLINGMVKK